MKSFKQFIFEALNIKDNPNFWRWFGKSKVVDVQGNPLIVFHTSVADVSTFKRIKDIGIHFGTQGQAADRYDLKLARDPYGPHLRGVKHNTMAVYIRLENPVRLDDAGNWGDSKEVARVLRRSGVISDDDYNTFKSKPIVSIRSWLKSKGYDGVVYTNIEESKDGYAYRKKKDNLYYELMRAFPNIKNLNDLSREDKASSVYIDWWNANNDYEMHKKASAEDSYIVFEPNQIKSAIGNNGDFDLKNPDITK